MGRALIFEDPEGATPLNPEGREGLKHGHVATRRELDALEQANIVQGMLWLERRRRSGGILTLDFLQKLHWRLFCEVWKWAGKFRTRESNIGVAPCEIAAQLEILVGDANYWADNQTYGPLEAGARLHHRMVQIHPFPNGNGRHARIAADVYLAECFGHAAIDWAGGNDLQEDCPRRAEYLAALRDADGHSFDRLLRFVGAPGPEG